MHVYMYIHISICGHVCKKMCAYTCSSQFSNGVRTTSGIVQHLLTTDEAGPCLKQLLDGARSIGRSLDSSPWILHRCWIPCTSISQAFGQHQQKWGFHNLYVAPSFEQDTLKGSGLPGPIHPGHYSGYFGGPGWHLCTNVRLHNPGLQITQSRSGVYTLGPKVNTLHT